MGENNKKSNGEQKEGGGDNKKKNNITVVLKADLHCDGCASKVVKCIRSFDGVDVVTIGEGQKITVVGMVDPVKLRDKVQQKTHKKVELISPQQPKKDGGDNKENDKGKENGAGEKGKKENENESKDKKDSNNKSEQKKPKEKEIPVTTAVFKLNLHCDGCIQKIYKHVIKTKGYQDMKIDKQQDLVTVTGAIDMKALAEVLSKQLKKGVEIVPPKKDGEKKDKGGGGGGDEKGKNGGEGGDEKKEGNKTQASMVGYPYPFMPGPLVIGDQLHYNPYPVYPYHAPQIFSDENPNACSVM